MNRELASDRDLRDFLARASTRPWLARSELADLRRPVRDDRAVAYEAETERLRVWLRVHKPSSTTRQPTKGRTER